jgi:hypothetical protein
MTRWQALVAAATLIVFLLAALAHHHPAELADHGDDTCAACVMGHAASVGPVTPSLHAPAAADSVSVLPAPHLAPRPARVLAFAPKTSPPDLV